jgi:peptide/nickel transport system ATP-binding protein
MSAPTVLELSHISHTFSLGGGLFAPKRELHALNDVSLQLKKGDVLGLVGESGCGKSTLARILLGLLEPTSGEVRMDGTRLGGHRRKDIARRIQPVFQDPYSSLNPRKTIGSIIELPLVVHSIGDRAERRERVEDIMAKVGLPSRLFHTYPGQLSGGQRQRVAIARALVIEPEVVICDEPTSALDVSVQSQILNLLLDLRERLELTYLFISHNLAVVEHIATRVAVMYLGRVVEEASTEEIFRHTRHPYTQALLASILTPEPSMGIPETHLGTSFPNPVNPPSGCHFHPRCPHAMPQCSTTMPLLAPTHGDAKIACHLYTETSSHA